MMGAEDLNALDEEQLVRKRMRKIQSRKKRRRMSTAGTSWQAVEVPVMQ
jgi:hypothetical protein